MAKVKRTIAVHVSPEQLERWQAWASHFCRPLPDFITAAVDAACNDTGLRTDQREQLRAIVEQARDALDKLAQALR